MSVRSRARASERAVGLSLASCCSLLSLWFWACSRAGRRALVPVPLLLLTPLSYTPDFCCVCISGNAATISTASGQSQHVAQGAVVEGDIIVVELQERDGLHFVGFVKNGEPPPQSVVKTVSRLCQDCVKTVVKDCVKTVSRLDSDCASDQ